MAVEDAGSTVVGVLAVVDRDEGGREAVMQADAAVRALIPPPAMTALEQQMLQLIQLIADEIGAYQPWMTPAGNGYAPTAAWGSSWEDEMAQGMAELGISF